MEYRRKEPFRYLFSIPIKSSLKIIKINDRDVESKEGIVEIHDISLNGARIACLLDLPYELEVQIFLTTTLNDSPVYLLGRIVWKKSYANHHAYGVEFLHDTSVKEQMLKELKLFAKRQLKNCIE